MWYYKNILMVFWDWWVISYWDNKISYLENKRYGNKPTHMRIRFWEMDGQICCLRKFKKKKLIRKHAHTDNTLVNWFRAQVSWKKSRVGFWAKPHSWLGAGFLLASTNRPRMLDLLQTKKRRFLHERIPLCLN